jgi:hypothetical protein
MKGQREKVRTLEKRESFMLDKREFQKMSQK